MIENKDAFIDFLIKAKVNTYAAGSVEPVPPSRPGSKDLHYTEGNYQYIDTYLGEIDFIGEEAVWQNGCAIWAMNYYGVMLVKEIPAGFIDCLLAALRQVPPEAPYRGPAGLEHGPFSYHCVWEGELGRFRGHEWIDASGETIYELDFHGGEVK